MIRGSTPPMISTPSSSLPLVNPVTILLYCYGRGGGTFPRHS
jgi:hypothetical protein